MKKCCKNVAKRKNRNQMQNFKNLSQKQRKIGLNNYNESIKFELTNPG